MDALTAGDDQIRPGPARFAARQTTVSVLWLVLAASGVLEPVLFALLAVRLAGFLVHQGLRRWRYRPGRQT